MTFRGETEYLILIISQTMESLKTGTKTHFIEPYLHYFRCDLSDMKNGERIKFSAFNVQTNSHPYCKETRTKKCKLNKMECFFRRPTTTPLISDMTISLLQLSHRIKSLEDKLLKSTFQKTIVRRF